MDGAWAAGASWKARFGNSSHQWVLAALCAAALALASAQAQAVEANQASPADLDAIKGIGPVMVERIVSARQQRPFANWSDFSNRVRGVGPATATRLSANGLTVNGRRLGQEPPPTPIQWQPMVPRPLEPAHSPGPAPKAHN